MNGKKETKLFKKFTVIRNSTGKKETEEYCCLRLSKLMSVERLRQALDTPKFKYYNTLTWKQLERVLLECEIEE